MCRERVSRRAPAQSGQVYSRGSCGSVVISLKYNPGMDDAEKLKLLREFVEADRMPMQRLAGESTITCMRACMGYQWALDDFMARLDELEA